MTQRVRLATAATSLAAFVLASAGCASLDESDKGAIIGAAGGAAVGGVIGSKTGSTTRGVLIGTAVGGAAGIVIGRRMEKQAEEITREIPDAQVTRIGEGIAVTFPEGILFPFDSASLKPEARTNLQKLARSLEDNPRTDVMIVGHTDAKGTDEYNQELSEKRAQAAVSYLSSQGVARSRLIPSGKGETDPVASNDDERGRAQNRRVEVAIYANEQWREEAKRTSGGGR
jgi:outer membrane protein OmpA-like peptidoglycan-associated protein